MFTDETNVLYREVNTPTKLYSDRLSARLSLYHNLRKWLYCRHRTAQDTLNSVHIDRKNFHRSIGCRFANRCNEIPAFNRLVVF